MTLAVGGTLNTNTTTNQILWNSFTEGLSCIKNSSLLQLHTGLLKIHNPSVIADHVPKACREFTKKVYDVKFASLCLVDKSEPN